MLAAGVPDAAAALWFYSRSDKSSFILSEAEAFLGAFFTFLLGVVKVLALLAACEALVGVFLLPLVVGFATLDSSVAVTALPEAAMSGAAVSARSLRACFDIEASLDEDLAATAGGELDTAAFEVEGFFLAGVEAIVAGDRSYLSAIVIFFPSSVYYGAPA